MSDNRYALNAAVMAIIIREHNGVKQLLLQKRQNTGFADGQWDFAATGHLEVNESLTQAMQREIQEEIGVEVSTDALHLCHICHLTDVNANYINCYFSVSEFLGEPQIMEATKCSALEWFPLNDLPDAMIPTRKSVLEHVLASSIYSEVGFA